jgi:uncharacterized protein YlxP (DUF503 family)
MENNTPSVTNMQEKRAIIRELIEQGKEKGSLAHKDIEELEKYGFTRDQINVLIDELRKSGVEIEEDFSDEDLKDIADIEERCLLPFAMHPRIPFLHFPHKQA